MESQAFYGEKSKNAFTPTVNCYLLLRGSTLSSRAPNAHFSQ